MVAGLDNPLHIAIVLVVVLMLFGAKRLPEMGKGLGEGMRGFKHALNGEEHPPAQQISLSQAPAPERTSAHAQPAAPRREQQTPVA